MHILGFSERYVCYPHSFCIRFFGTLWNNGFEGFSWIFCQIHDCMLDDLSGFHYFFGTIILENSSKITINLAKNEKKNPKMSKYIFQQIPGTRSITKYSRYIYNIIYPCIYTLMKNTNALWCHLSFQCAFCTA